VAAAAVISLLRVVPRFWVPPAQRRLEQEANGPVASTVVPH
jgi:hypothetical protein